jgi:hypothetical protein
MAAGEACFEWNSVVTASGMWVISRIRGFHQSVGSVLDSTESFGAVKGVVCINVACYNMVDVRELWLGL